ncbi:MAG: DUF3575 domain-containing protein [Flavobacterium sp.]|nr:DUF3575 domain-containing protein [Flavobacterium sp.]
MNRTILFLLICVSAAAQDKIQKPAYEIRTNVLSAISQGGYNLSIEKKTSTAFSYGISLTKTSSPSLESKYENGNKSHLSNWDLTPFVRYKFSDSNRSFYFAEAFTALNQGKYKTIIRNTSAEYAVYQIEKGNYLDLALGGSMGYHILIKNNWTAEFLVGFGSNLLQRTKSPDVVSRVGLSIGYQFNK